ncbi:MAG: inner membrane protein CreD [Verrucomicrobiota bacterium]
MSCRPVAGMQDVIMATGPGNILVVEDEQAIAETIVYALCLFYLALLALGEVLTPSLAYIGAAAASSLLIVCYSAAILKSYVRAGLIAGLLTAEHGVLYVVLRMEDYALLAGTSALFTALGAVMFFTRNVDWFANEAAKREGA